MRARIGLTLLLVGVPASAMEAQQSPSPDSLVAHWLEHGAVADWQPYRLFTGCPNLQGWQRRGFELLLAADLSRERANDLARAWMFPLRGCRDARLEQWYFEHIDAAIRRGEPEGMLLSFWSALQHGDSPAIRDYLRNLMLDASKPEPYRDVAGATLFGRFGRGELLREYLRAFETMRLPPEVAVGVTERLLKQDADRLLREVGARVRSRPELAVQLAFTGIVESSDRYASTAARRGLSEALRAGLGRPGLTASQRARLEGSAEHLMRPKS